MLKANQATTYTHTEVDNALLLKANQSTTYTKTEVDGNLLLKANQATTYTKTEVDDILSTKADSSDIYERDVLYTKIETNNLLNNKQNNLTTDLTDDTTTHKMRNGNIVKILEEGTHINIESHPTKLVINSTTDLSNDYTQTEVNSLLNNKQDSISSTGNFKVYEHSYGL